MDASPWSRGAARGIGAAIAHGLAAARATVVGRATSTAAAAERRWRIAWTPGQGHRGRHGRRRPPPASPRRSTTSVRTLGPPAILVNNAGIDVIKPFVDSTEDEWDRIIAVNLKGTDHLQPGRARRDDRAQVRAHRQHRLRRRSGRVVRRSRVLGHQGRRHRVHQDAGPGDGAARHHRQLRLPRARPRPRCSARSPSTARSSTTAWPGHPARPHRPARRHRPAVAFLASDDACVHHRPDAVRQRRTDDGMTATGRRRSGCAVDDGVAVLSPSIAPGG